MSDALTVRGEDDAGALLRFAVRRPVIARALTRWWAETGERAAADLADPAQRPAWLADLAATIATALDEVPDRDVLVDAIADLNAAVEAYAILHTATTGEFEEPAAAQRWKRLRTLVVAGLSTDTPESKT